MSGVELMKVLKLQTKSEKDGGERWRTKRWKRREEHRDGGNYEKHNEEISYLEY